MAKVLGVLVKVLGVFVNVFGGFAECFWGLKWKIKRIETKNSQGKTHRNIVFWKFSLNEWMIRASK